VLEPTSVGLDSGITFFGYQLGVKNEVFIRHFLSDPYMFINKNYFLCHLGFYTMQEPNSYSGKTTLVSLLYEDGIDPGKNTSKIQCFSHLVLIHQASIFG